MSDAHLMTVAGMRACDAHAIAGGITGFTLMRHAGGAIADRARALVPDDHPILVLCGPGNNGGDGFVAAQELVESGYRVALHLLGTVESLAGDAALAAAAWSGGADPLEAMGDPAAYGLVVDALFGAGLARDVEGVAASAIAAVNASGVPVLSVDVPSGVDGDTGAVRGLAVQATETVTFVALKPGHLLEPGRSLCGTVHVAAIGSGRAAHAEGLARSGPAMVRNGPELWLAHLPRLTASSHKYTRGHAVVLSGPAYRTGAARLAARAALRVGAGLVTLASPTSALPENAAHLTAIMLRASDTADDLDDLLVDERLNVVLAGPGLGIGEATRDLVAVAAAVGRGLVLDADALTSFKGQAALLGAHVADGGGTAVLTPHEGEFERLFADTDALEEGLSKLDRTRRAAALVGAVVVLKGADTVVAAPDGRVAINDHASAHLGTAGSGDVLGGLVAGLLAQGMPAFEAAAAAVWLHGDAGLRFGPGLIAEDLPEMLPTVLAALAGE
ncbi:NAD(P)H-hydrate epimerase [Methylobacterium sp. Leaf399]|uniref:NAD(P)H-hydrate dehydratase n=1 Tax=Methylobacterium sp. Leaf399 TaxID=1736364 RepID=UPI0006F9FDEC|nr:NAD(P)H-hydrate dehydratase [Methylobacterium sp. Leaf399]KQT08556.1 NAD(P)H-hydrate epimerase [Methylobacterium sp. Leaf399]